MAQLYYENVTEGMDLPVTEKTPITRTLVQWAGASGDYFELHYDKDFALANGLPGVIVHGWLVLSFLGQMITDWMGSGGTLVKLGGSYRGMNPVGEDIICNGKVTRKYIEDNKHYVRVEVWAENPQGERTVSGSAVVMLPSRA